jgi:tRNA pseudouridine38-40 synthase
VRYAITLSYNGARYHGWQRQTNSISVQQVIEEHLETLFRGRIKLTGCGRTDTGVHAKHFVAHFDFEGDLPESLVFRLNGMLPPDIAISEIQEVSNDFQARFTAIRRDYSYHLHFQKDPFKEGFSWFRYHYPDFNLMNEAASLLIGKKEFACFCKGPAPGGNYHCDVYNAKWEFDETNAVFHIGADRFLRNMVRAIVGTLLEVGYHKMSMEEFSEVLLSKNRSDAGNSVHACGLFLTKVTYPEGFL